MTKILEWTAMDFLASPISHLLDLLSGISILHFYPLAIETANPYLATLLCTFA